MQHKIVIARRTVLLGGLALVVSGLLASAGIGYVVGSKSAETPDRLLSELGIPLHAASAYAQDSYVVATGPLDGDLEGFYFLDALTGELKVAVMNPRSREFIGLISRKIMDDFSKGGNLKNPHFMMVTGAAQLQQIGSSGNSQYGDSLVYIAELTSGKLSCYGLKLSPNLRTSSKKDFRGQLGHLDIIEFRKTAIRDAE